MATCCTTLVGGSDGCCNNSTAYMQRYRFFSCSWFCAPTHLTQLIQFAPVYCRLQRSCGVQFDYSYLHRSGRIGIKTRYRKRITYFMHRNTHHSWLASCKVFEPNLSGGLGVPPLRKPATFNPSLSPFMRISCSIL